MLVLPAHEQGGAGHEQSDQWDGARCRRQLIHLRRAGPSHGCREARVGTHRPLAVRREPSVDPHRAAHHRPSGEGPHVLQLA
eukprot:1181502-Prorocentrum_minimum.AAC.2